MNTFFPKYLEYKLPNDVNDKCGAFIGEKDSGKTGAAYAVGERLMGDYKPKNCEVLLFDPDMRSNQKYVMENLFDFPAARKEIMERYEGCTKKTWILIASDARRLLSTYFCKKEERQNVLDFIYWFLASRHIGNPEVENAFWFWGLHKWQYLDRGMRENLNFTVFKSCAGNADPLGKFYGLSRKQINLLLDDMTFRTMVLKIVNAGTVIITRKLAKRMLFPKPTYLIDFDKKRERRPEEIMLEKEDMMLDTRITLKAKLWKFLDALKQNGCRTHEVARAMDWLKHGSNVSNFFKNELNDLVNEIYDNYRPAEEEGEIIGEVEESEGEAEA
jgi:hypothetical protein